MSQLFTKKAITAFLLATSAATVSAQTFNAPVANSVIYGDPHVVSPQRVSNHAIAGNASYLPSLGLGVVDLYVAAWNDPNPGAISEVTIMLNSSGGTTPIWQSSIIYKDVQDLEVGSRRNPLSNETTVLVAYYQTGVGHFLDEYKLGAGGATGLISQTQLSNSTVYGRIRMDFHALWNGAIAWINPSINAIETIVYNNNTWTTPTVLNGTSNMVDMDIALETYITGPSASSTNELHLVYSDGTSITESSLNFNALTFSPPTMFPTVNDIAPAAPIGLQSRLTLDCPGFSLNGSRWAYTYGEIYDVIVRFRDPAVAGGAAQTQSMTTGALGNASLAGSYKMHNPTINYEHIPGGGYQNDMMVAWYATDGSGFNNYIALKMDPTGSTVTSTWDYLNLPNGQMPFAPSSFTSGVALNKTDAKTPSSYSYAAYYNVDPITGLNQLHHAFHPWGNTLFRGEAPELDLAADSRISTYPNPFNDQFNVTINAKENSVVELILTDINGRTVAHTNNVVYKGSHQINMDKLNSLAPGNYLLTVLANQQKIAVKKVTKQ